MTGIMGTNRLVLLCAAIFHAEGFWVSGSMPRRNNNPGDILDHTGRNTAYPDRVTGVGVAVHEVLLMLSGTSRVYFYSMTWRTIADRWTGGDNAAAWCASVCDDLGVDPDSTLGEFAGVTAAQLASSPAPAPPADPAA